MKIAYVGPFDFPSSNANSLRVSGMIDALLMAGHHVQVCAFTSHNKEKMSNIDSEQVQVSYAYEYDKGLLSGVNIGLRGYFYGFKFMLGVT